MFKSVLISVFFIFNGGGLSAFADEGMWTLDNLPKEQIRSKYGVDITDSWVDKVMKSSVRLANGCSGSFVSDQGLVMTNHHCVRGCIYQLSSKKEDLLKKGFHATNNKQERHCTQEEINQLIDITDVSSKVKSELRGLSGENYAKKKKEVAAKLEKECAENTEKFRCDLVSLYHGGEFHLYKYRRYQDVRLVFAPEGDIAHFGGDPDNFNFPRYAYDVSFLRVYDQGKPVQSKNFFKWSKATTQDKLPTFITGHPGSTQRLLTVAQLEYIRDSELPSSISYLSELRGRLMQFQKTSAEFKRIAQSRLAGVDNSLKAFKGRVGSLRDKSFFNKIATEEKNFRYQLSRNPRNERRIGNPWKEIEQAIEEFRHKAKEVKIIGYGNFDSELFDMARTLVRKPVESKKPNGERYSEFTDSRWPRAQQRLLSPAPIYKDLVYMVIEFALIKMREALSPDHDFVKKVLGKKSPAQLAEKWVSGTQLHKADFRKKLLEGGAKAIEASKDPMIALAKLIDQDSRKWRDYVENEYSPVINKNSEVIAQEKFRVFGKNTYPDATFSLRLTYGQIKGWKEGDKNIEPFTQTSGLWERSTGVYPFAPPASWVQAKKSLSSKTHFNFVSNNDIIGGNSGSPVINAKTEVVGLVFDGNIHSLGGAYAFDENMNRAVSVDVGILREALDKVYGAKNLVKELD